MNEGDRVECEERWEPYGEGYRLWKQNRGTLRARAAALGFVGGAVSLLLGSLLTLAAWFEAATSIGASLNRLGLVSFLLSFPLLALGAHCLDLLEKTSRAGAPTVAPRAVNRRIVNLRGARHVSRRGLSTNLR